ncbi:DUF3156 domain-containing protein, partial [Burkholderia pseudomallei]
MSGRASAIAGAAAIAGWRRRFAPAAAPGYRC